MYVLAYKNKEGFRWPISFVLYFAVCIQIGSVPSMVRNIASPTKPILSSLSKGVLYSSSSSSSIIPKTDVLFRDETVLQNVRYQDPISQELLKHLMTSPKYEQLKFAKNIKAVETLKLSNNGLSLAESKVLEALRAKGGDIQQIPKNAVKLQLWGKYLNVDWEKLSSEEFSGLVNQVIEKLSADTKNAREVVKKYSGAISKRKYGVLMDNEADDLFYLLTNFEDGIIPKFIVVYGGFTELRYRAVQEFIRAACSQYQISEENIPKIYRGFPHFYKKGDHRHSYDFEEGSGYINDNDRVNLIEESQRLEEKLKGEKPYTWSPDAWKDPVFEPGLNALRNLIDEEGYSAIAVLTSPAALTYLIKEDPSRINKFGVTMASPYSYLMNDKGVLYKEAYNARRQMSLTNEIIKSGVDFIGVGGGTAKSEGLRSIHDYRLGRNGENLYSDLGLEHLERVISKESPFEILRIIGFAGHNVSAGKWRDWDEMFGKLWKFLEINEPLRPGLEKLRTRPQGVIELWEKETARAKKEEKDAEEAEKAEKAKQEKEAAESKGTEEVKAEGQESAEVLENQAAKAGIPAAEQEQEATESGNTEVEADDGPESLENVLQNEGATTSTNSEDTKVKADEGPEPVENVLQKEPAATSTKSEEKEKKEEIPEVAKWELDRLMTILKIWYLFGHRVPWQGPSADLHAAITVHPYTKGVLGAVRYASESWPVKLDKEGKPIIKDPKLDKMVNSDVSNHYSVSDMNYQLIIKRVQRILNGYYEKMVSVEDQVPRSNM